MNDTPKVVELLHAGVKPPAEIMLFIMPTRNFRVVRTDEAGRSFRLEQIVKGGREWKPLSSHNGTFPYESLMPAYNAGCKAQNMLMEAQDAREARAPG